MSASPVLPIADDALNLVQAQYEVSGLILGSDSPIDILRGIHRFTGEQYSTAHLAFVGNDTDPALLHIVAEGNARAVRSADRRASLGEYPLAERLAALQPVYIEDIREDPAMTDDERDALRSRGVRSVLLVPLVAEDRLAGMISLSHDEPVTLSTVRVHALRNLATQLALVINQRQQLALAQATARQEQQVNALVANLQTPHEVSDLLRMALTELGQALGAKSGTVRVIAQPDTEGAVS